MTIEEERQAIQEWVNNRLNTPNFFNTQILFDLLQFAIDELGYTKKEEK